MVIETARIRRVLPLSDSMALFGASGTRAIEQREAAGLPPHTLMERAGDSLARLALALAPHAQRIWVAAGPGNNGGDGLEAASRLQCLGKHVTVTLFGDAGALPPDAREALARARSAGVRIEAHGATGATGTVAALGLRDRPDLAIDALLGIGAASGPSGVVAEAIDTLNALGCAVLAADLPSGLHPDTGQPLGSACTVATHTLSLLTLKPGLFTGAGRDHSGTVWLDTLGTEPAIADTPLACLTGRSANLASRRRHAQNKGSFGDVAVVGGSHGMNGAALLAARAAHAAGAGRVYVDLLDDASAPAVDLLRPELMFRRGWSKGAPERLTAATVVCGCGGGDAVRAVLPRLLGSAGRLVLDADALNAIAIDAALVPLLRARAARGRATVITPHPLEAARLLGCSSAEVQADRLRAADELASRFRVVAVLKGSGSIVAAPGAIPCINSTGNAALATAGTGDVLAGWLGGQWGQSRDSTGLPTVTQGAAQSGSSSATDEEMALAFAVACRAVAEHGAAAEPAPNGPLRAGDLVERLYTLR